MPLALTPVLNRGSQYIGATLTFNLVTSSNSSNSGSIDLVRGPNPFSSVYSASFATYNSPSSGFAICIDVTNAELDINLISLS
jgi:hypothetical protein